MPLDSKTVAGNERLIYIAGDPNVASQLQSVLTLADGKSLAGLGAAVVGSVNWLFNGTLYDLQRSAPGTTGIVAVNTEGAKPTYSVATLGFTPVATPTDIWQLVGSATKVVRLLRIAISGFATAAISVDIQLLRRSTASTGGSPTVPSPVSHDTNDAGATAVVNQFTANPTLGTVVGAIRAAKLNLGATGAAGSVVWDFSQRNDKAIVLRGVAQQVSLNWNAAAVPAGTLLDIDCEFSEE